MAAVSAPTGSTHEIKRPEHATSEMVKVAEKVVKALIASREQRQWIDPSNILFETRVNALLIGFVGYATTGQRPPERSILNHVNELTPISSKMRKLIGQYAQLSGYTAVWKEDQIELISI